MLEDNNFVICGFNISYKNKTMSLLLWRMLTKILLWRYTNAEITLSWAHKQDATGVHKSFSVYAYTCQKLNIKHDKKNHFLRAQN